MEAHLGTYFKELGRKHVTRQLLWEEYRVKVPDGYSYTQFCHHLTEFTRMRQATMVQQHTPGEVMQVDFAGDTISYVDATSGEIVSCPVLICVLPFSGLLFAVALADATQGNLITGLNAALAYYEGVTRSVKSDNLSQLVRHSNRYEPSFTELAQQWAVHNRTTMMATRVGKPKDKPTVENAVRLTYYRVYAPLRDETFFSLRSLNGAISEKVHTHNLTHFQNKDYSRRDLFEREERASLGPLPLGQFSMFWVTHSKVGKNYHVTTSQDMHFYSVPYKYIGKRVSLQYSRDTVEVFYAGDRIAFHPRSLRRYGYTTLGAHMPETHRHFKAEQEWDEQHFLNLAEQVGPQTLAMVERVFLSRVYSQQAFNTCKGILRLGGKYGSLRLEAACLRASSSGTVSYKVLENILAGGLDALKDEGAVQRTLANDNLRGNSEYQ